MDRNTSLLVLGGAALAAYYFYTRQQEGTSYSEQDLQGGFQYSMLKPGDEGYEMMYPTAGQATIPTRQYFQDWQMTKEKCSCYKRGERIPHPVLGPIVIETVRPTTDLKRCLVGGVNARGERGESPFPLCIATINDSSANA